MNASIKRSKGMGAAEAAGALFALFFALASGEARAAVSVQIENPVVVLTPAAPATGTEPAGQPVKSIGELTVRVDGSEQAPKISKIDHLGGVEIVAAPAAPWRETGGRVWHFRIEVTNLPPNTLQKKTVTVEVAATPPKTETLPFWVTNRALKSPQIQDPIKPWIVGGLLPGTGNRCTSFVVSPGDIPVTGIKILQSNLARESPRGVIGVENLKLCSRPDECEAEQVRVDTGQPGTVSVCLDENFWGHGKFTGTVILAVDHSTEAKTVNVELYKSDTLVRALGFLAILGGVLLGWWVKVIAKARLGRYQALLPALALEDRLVALLARLEKIPAPFSGAVGELKKRIGELRAELTVEKLDRFLPPAFPLPWNQGPPDAAAYKEFLEEKGNETATLRTLIEEGVEKALERLPDKKEDAVLKALKAIDAIAAEPLPSVAQAREKILTILAELDDSQLDSLRESAAQQKPLTLQQVQVRIEQLSRTVWLVWGLLTSLAGLAVLILDNPGFGTPLDFLLAVFWGVGLPSVLSQLTPDSVTTELGVAVPGP